MLALNEKLAGRKFRDEQTAILTASLESDPPTYRPPNFLSHFRHECPGRKDISTAIELKEMYVLSPMYYVTVDGAVIDIVEGADPPEESEPGEPGVKLAGGEIVPMGRFGFIYKEGKCRNRGCGQTARSPAGRLVDAWERGPAVGRVVRSGA